MHPRGESFFGRFGQNNHVAHGSGPLSYRYGSHRFVRAEVTFLLHLRSA